MFISATFHVLKVMATVVLSRTLKDFCIRFYYKYKHIFITK